MSSHFSASKILTIGLLLSSWIFVQGQEADLELNKSCDHNVVMSGSEMTYTLNVSNVGPDTSDFLGVSDTLPDGAVFVTADPECTFQALEKRCDCFLPALGPGESHDFHITVQALSGSSMPSVYLTGELENTSEPGIFVMNNLDGIRQPVSLNDQLVAPRGLARQSHSTMLVVDIRNPTITLDSVLNADGALIQINLETGLQTVISEGGFLVNPQGVLLSPSGMVYVADPDSGETFGRILRIHPVSGVQEIISELELLQHPTGLAMEEGGSLVVADASGAVLRVDPETGVQEILSAGGTFISPEAIALESSIQAVVADSQVGLIRVSLETGDQSVLASVESYPFEFQQPMDIEVAYDGKLYVADPVAFDFGAILQFDPITGVLDAGYLGGPEMVFARPHALELTDMLYNFAYAFSETPDPNSDNNTSSVSTEIVEPSVVWVDVQETIQVSDQVSVEGPVMIDVNEAITVTDQVQVLPPVILDINENIVVTDLTLVTGPVIVAISEGITVTDQVQIIPPVVVVVAETVTVADQVGLTGPVILSVQETITVQDQPVALPPIIISVLEALTVSDLVHVSMPVVIQINEAIHVSDDVVLENSVGPPTVVSIHTIAGNEPLNTGTETDLTITQLLIQFSEPVYDPPGNTEGNDVTNPANFLLVAPGENGEFDTIGCEGGVQSDDIALSIGPISYDPQIRTAVVKLNAPPVVPAGPYRLFVCGSTSIVDLEGEPLDGDGDGTGGDDHIIRFAVLVTNLLQNPNFDQDLTGWSWNSLPEAEVLFDEGDSSAPNLSGSVFVANHGSTGQLELEQCVSVTAGSWARLGGKLMMRSLSGESEAFARVEWYAGEDCSGSLLDEWIVPNSEGSTEDDWINFRATQTVPNDCVSARVTFVGSAGEGADYEMQWDELYFFLDPTLIRFEGFESGDLGNWPDH